MKRALRRAATPVPRTLAATWLCAAFLNRRPERDHLAAQLSGPQPGLRDDFAVVETACEIAASRYFGSDYDVRSVNDLADLVRRTSAGELRLTLMQIEAVIRAALGEQDVDLRGINLGAKLRVEILAGAGLVHWLELDEPAVRSLLVAAEDMAVGRGFHPRPISTSPRPLTQADRTATRKRRPQ
jgi:hypothetical protein